MANVNVMKLDRELRAAGIPIDGCAADGRLDFQTEATEAQRMQAAAILAAHDPTEIPAPSLEEQVAAMKLALDGLLLGG